MKDLLNKTTSAIAGVALFCFGCMMAGIGLFVVMLLALFAMAAAGLAILATPFVAMAQQGEDDTIHQDAANA